MSDQEQMEDVSHANPADPRNVFGEMFRRGPSTSADGGRTPERDAGPGDEEVASDPQTMADVSHTNPEGPDGERNRVWERGGERTVTDE